jgi:hypothetical protein
MNENHRDEEIVKICSAKDLVDLTMLKEALREAGIECMDRSYSDSAYNDIFVPSKGFADIFVFVSDRNKAAEVISALNNQAE